MRIGVCAWWYNRGQGIVARQLRTILDGLGHETFVLARPTRRSNIRPGFIDRSDVWDQPGITEASDYEIPGHEYLDWAREHELEAVFFDQNYDFGAIAALRRHEVRTIGRFVWEYFSEEHVRPATDALDVIYSLTACEEARYSRMGIKSPRVRWGIHPDLYRYADARRGPSDEVVFLYPAGVISKRKPVGAMLAAFSQTKDPRLRLLVKAQVERRFKPIHRAVAEDPRIQVVIEDQPTDEHLRNFAAADVCLAPSRWEGLGLHLYEATALAVPLITNDNPPMNEVVEDGVNGVLVASRRHGTAKSGIPAFEPDVGDLRRAIERLADRSERNALRAGARIAQRRLDWRVTVDGYVRLLDAVA